MVRLDADTTRSHVIKRMVFSSTVLLTMRDHDRYQVADFDLWLKLATEQTPYRA